VQLLLVYIHGGYRALHSFPTRRSSDLLQDDLEAIGNQRRAAVIEAFGAIAALQQETPAFGGVGKQSAQGEDFPGGDQRRQLPKRSEEHTSDSSHVKISYAVFCLKKKNK